MATIIEIPLDPQPQVFNIDLGGTSYRLGFSWCDPMGAWVLRIADIDDTEILSGIPLVTGTDLLAQFEYLGIGGLLVVQSDDDIDALPTFDNLGQTSHLYFIIP